MRKFACLPVGFICFLKFPLKRTGKKKQAKSQVSHQLVTQRAQAVSSSDFSLSSMWFSQPWCRDPLARSIWTSQNLCWCLKLGKQMDFYWKRNALNESRIIFVEKHLC